MSVFRSLLILKMGAVFDIDESVNLNNQEKKQKTTYMIVVFLTEDIQIS